MIDVLQFFSSKPACESKPDSIAHGDRGVDLQEFDSILQEIKDSIKSIPDQHTNRSHRNLGQNQTNNSDEEGAPPMDDGGMNHHISLNGYNWLNYLQLYQEPVDGVDQEPVDGVDQEQLDLPRDEAVLNIGNSSHEKDISVAVSHDLSISLDNQVVEISPEIKNNIFQTLSEWDQNNEFDDSIQKEIDSNLRESIDNIEVSKNTSMINETNVETIATESQIHFKNKELKGREIIQDIPQDNEEGQEQAQRILDHRTANKTFHGKVDDFILPRVRLKEFISVASDRVDESFSLDEKVPDNENGQLNGLGLVNNDVKEMNLDFSNVLRKQDPIELAQIIDQLANKVAMTLGEKGSEMEIQIKPEHLGKIILKIAMEDGIFTGKIYTTNEQVKGLLQSNLDDLRTSLKDQGFIFTSLDVDVGSQSNPNSFHHLAQTKPRIAKVDSPISITGMEEKIPSNGGISINNLNQIDFLA